MAFRSWGRGVAATLGGLAVLWLGLRLVCGGEPPGEGAKAEQGYRRAAPVREALEAYRAAHGRYPDSLSALTPTYLPASALASSTRRDDELALHYRRVDSGYALAFNYFGPGSNTCVFRSTTDAWQCRGHF